MFDIISIVDSNNDIHYHASIDYIYIYIYIYRTIIMWSAVYYISVWYIVKSLMAG